MYNSLQNKQQDKNLFSWNRDDALQLQGMEAISIPQIQQLGFFFVLQLQCIIIFLKKGKKIKHIYSLVQ